MAPCPITVSSYAPPTISLASNLTVTVGSSITIPASSATKVGTLYVVPSTTDLSITNTQAALDALVATKTALKAAVTDVTKAVTITTKTGTANAITLSGATATYKVVAVDLAGNLSTLSANTITINNAPVAALTATDAAGSAYSATKVTAIVTSGTSDNLAYEISNALIPIPPTGAVKTASDFIHRRERISR